MAASKPFSYSQLGIGDCGHVVHTWPQITSIGGKNPEVICDECTRIKWNLTPEDRTTIWVCLKSPDIKPTPVKPKVSRPKKEKPLTAWQTLLREEGLF